MESTTMATKPKKAFLPPCRVCNGPGNGFHYGVNTCDGCKGFFHRGLTQHTGYVCRRQNKCVIQYGRGRLCQSCRFKKCLAVGMSKEAIKAGRYTSEKRSAFIREVKMLEERNEGSTPDLQEDEGSMGFGNSTDLTRLEQTNDRSDNKNATQTIKQSGSPVTSDTVINSPLKRADYHLLSFVGTPESPSSPMSNHPESSQIHSHNPSPGSDDHSQDSLPMLEEFQSMLTPSSAEVYPSEADVSNSPTINTRASITGSAGSPLTMTAYRYDEFCSPYSDNTSEQESTKYIMDLYTDNMSGVLQVLTESHEKALQHHSWSPQDLRRETQKYYDYCKTRHDMFGDLPRLRDEEYNDVFQRTGIDVDGRQGRFSVFGDGVERCIRTMIKFIKPLPGFADLQLEDQTNLLKHNRLEFSFLCNYMYANIELGVVACLSGRWNCLLDAKSPQKYKVSKAYLDLCAKLQSFNLTEEERVILKAMSVMNPDRTDLKNLPFIAQIHWNLTEMFIFTLGKSHKNPQLLFAKIINVLTDFREVEEGMINCVKSWNISQFSQLHTRPLLEELVSDFYIPSK